MNDDILSGVRAFKCVMPSQNIFHARLIYTPDLPELSIVVLTFEDKTFLNIPDLYWSSTLKRLRWCLLTVMSNSKCISSRK